MAFSAVLETVNTVAKITLSGDLDASSANQFKEKIEEAATQEVTKLVLVMNDLEYMASAGLRMLIFSKQKMGADVEIYVVAPNEMVLDTIEKTGFHHSVTIVDSYED